MTWFSYAGRKSLGFSVSIEIDLLLVWVIEIALISVWGWNLTSFQWRDVIGLLFCVGGRNWIDFSAGIGIDLVSMWRSKMTSFSVWIEINSVFVSGHRNRLNTRARMEIDLISVMGY